MNQWIICMCMYGNANELTKLWTSEPEFWMWLIKIKVNNLHFEAVAGENWHYDYGIIIINSEQCGEVVMLRTMNTVNESIAIAADQWRKGRSVCVCRPYVWAGKSRSNYFIFTKP